MSGFVNELLKFCFESRSIHGEVDGLIDQGRIQEHIGKLNGVNALYPGCNQWSFVADGLDEIAHQDGVGQLGIAKRNVDLPDFWL